MKHAPVRIQCLTARTGVLYFDKSIGINQYSLISIQEKALALTSVDPKFFAKDSGYYCTKNAITFFLIPEHALKNVYQTNPQFLVSGEFNQWTLDVAYALKWNKKERAWLLKVPRNTLQKKSFDFKFVTSDGLWLEPWAECPNVHCDMQGNRNLRFSTDWTGDHIVHFEVGSDFDFAEPLNCVIEGLVCPVDILPQLSLLSSKTPLGVKTGAKCTSFACFAPQAKRVEVKITKDHIEEIHPLIQNEGGVWSTTLPKNYTDYHYVYRIWNPQLQEVVDPYALQLVAPRGPGIIRSIKPLKDHFIAPQLKDLSIFEVHVRDLLEHAPITEKGSVFHRLNGYLSHKNYVTDLGINCVEFMPLTEFDANTKDEYQWGYMPAHYFSLSSLYGTPEEFQCCVQTLHQQGIAVIMDVVFNHAGKMNDLMRWDPVYYFRHNPDGTLTNTSGCGNDLQTEMPQVKRLICDSLLHFLKTYHVDGFRFDLAELLGLDTLRFIEKELRAYKQEVILIAEPWSFRNHIAYRLKESSYSCWNDGYREFLHAYVQGKGNIEGLKYFLSGSTSYLCHKTQQSINYTESHDDYCWMDRLEGNEEIKRRQTHCMFAILLLSCGIPMISEGQDYRRSKHQVRNTYNRGDLNALNYEALKEHEVTHRYVQQLLKLRASPLGALLKIEKPNHDYFQYFYVKNTSALGTLFNANHQCGSDQLLLVINPQDIPITFDFSDFQFESFVCLANTDIFLRNDYPTLPPTLKLRPYSCAIFANTPQ